MNYYKSVAVGSIKKFIPQEKRHQDSISRSLIEKLAWDPNKSFHGHARLPTVSPGRHLSARWSSCAALTVSHFDAWCSQRLISLNLQRVPHDWWKVLGKWQTHLGFTDSNLTEGGWKESRKTICWWIKSEKRHMETTAPTGWESKMNSKERSQQVHIQKTAVSQEAPLPALASPIALFSLLVWPQHFPMATFLWSAITVAIGL